MTSLSIQLVLFYCVFRNLLRFHNNQFGDKKLFLLHTVLLFENYLMFTWDKISFSFSFLFFLEQMKFVEGEYCYVYCSFIVFNL